jgi:hypothetical protein
MISAKRSMRHLVTLSLLGYLSFANVQSQNTTAKKKPINYANGLVGTAPLDNQILIGNAPPPGEHLYSGFTSPGAVLPHGSTNIAPINSNLDVSYPAGVRASYFYPNRTMVGFSGGTSGGPTVMPMVGNWTVPPDRSVSVYGKAREKSSPGYYAVYLYDFRTNVEVSATTWTGIYRFTFPQTDPISRPPTTTTGPDSRGRHRSWRGRFSDRCMAAINMAWHFREWMIKAQPHHGM